MTKQITVLGIDHRIQGAEKRLWNISDPHYKGVIDWLLRGKDFLFEEVSGLGPTTAKQVVESKLGPGRYLDVDPHKDERLQHGIGPTDSQSFSFDPCSPDSGFYCYHFASEHAKREVLWGERVNGTEFKRALFICGMMHALSMSYRFLELGYEVETLTYERNPKLEGPK